MKAILRKGKNKNYYLKFYGIFSGKTLTSFVYKAVLRI